MFLFLIRSDAPSINWPYKYYWGCENKEIRSVAAGAFLENGDQQILNILRTRSNIFIISQIFSKWLSYD